jgi:gamma-glutamylputrescine oxidase
MRDIPFFIDTFPRSRRPDYPRHRGEGQTAVVIVGGGLTGCACAAAFASAGIRVTLLERERIGYGATGRGAGLLRHDLDASFQDSCAAHGLRTARHVWQGFRRASLDFAAALRRFGIRADLAAQDVLLFSREGADGGRRLQREYHARRDAGLETSWLTPRAVSAETAIQTAGAIRSKADALNLYRACVGLASVAAARGASIHERTGAVRIRVRRKAVEVKTDSGVITADAVLIASGALIDDLRALRRHFARTQSYFVVTENMPAAVRREVGKRTTALGDTAQPPHRLRWLGDDRVLFSGLEQEPIPPRQREKALIPHVNQLMYELTTIYPAISGLQPEWGWDAHTYASPDSLPVIGPHRNFPRHLFALGAGRHGPGFAWLAARVLLRAYAGESAKGDELFGFPRIL